MNSGNKNTSPKVPLSGALPSTDEIDDDWGEASEPKLPSAAPTPGMAAVGAEPTPAPEPESPPSSVTSKPPATEEVDSGWLADAEDERHSALESPSFPVDRQLPSDLAAQVARALASPAPTRVGAEPSRAEVRSAAPPVVSAHSRSDEAGQKTQASERLDSARVSQRPSPALEAPLPGAGARAAPRGRPWLSLFSVVIVAGFAVWFLRRAEPAPELTKGAEPRPAVSAALPDSVPDPPAAAVPAKSPTAPAAAPDSSAPAAPPTEPAVAGAAVEAPTPSASATAGNIAVLLKVRPPHARIFRHGKEVGPAPVTIELAPGERRFFEVGAPGYTTRKVIVDGTTNEMTVGLRAVEPMSGAPVGTSN